MGKLLKILGVLFLILIVGGIALMFWAHGEGEAQQKKFFDVVAAGDAAKFIDMMDAKAVGQIDPPVVKMWMDWVNEKLGGYKGLAATEFNTNKKMTGEGTLVISEGRAEFEKGEAQVKLSLLNDKIVSFEVTSDALKGNWFKLPLKGPFYRDRAKKFIKHLIDLEIETALDITHKELRKQLTIEQCKSAIAPLVEEGESLESITVVNEEFIDGKEDKSLKIGMMCQFKNGKMLAYVRFDFDSVRAHLMAFRLPCSPEQAGLDPDKPE